MDCPDTGNEISLRNAIMIENEDLPEEAIETIKKQLSISQIIQKINTNWLTSI
jgi:hypothetical protein